MTSKKIARSKRKQKASAANPAILRAAERLNGKPEKTSADHYDAAVRHVSGLVGEHIVRACDQIGEEIATYAEHDCINVESLGNIADALLSLWRVRWELGMTDRDVTYKVKAAEHVIERAVRMAEKQEANGAAAEGGAS
jgi:hypothetical protein